MEKYLEWNQLGYLNCHEERNIQKSKITEAKAKEKLNSRIEINSQNLAIIPTEFGTEILCWEFKGKAGDNEFLVYINAENGKEEDILMIVNTPNRNFNNVKKKIGYKNRKNEDNIDRLNIRRY